MKKYLLLFSFVAIVSVNPLHAQVAIGIPGNPPDASAMLDVQSTNKGMLIPRMTEGERNGIGSPAKGLLVYDNSYDALYVYRNNTQQWTQLGEKIWVKYNGNAIYESGNVGIHTFSPATSLHIKTGELIYANKYGYLLLGDSASVNVSFSNKEIQARIAEYTSTLYLQPMGSGVHIGGATTESPNTQLFIPTGADAGMDELNSGFIMMGRQSSANMVLDNNEIVARNNGVSSTLFLQNDGGGVNIGGGTYSTTLKLGVNGDAIFNGKVRIGSTALPVGYNFGVDGKMICEEVQVKLKTDWADYVFAPDYNLRPISQVAAFVKQNNHLPGIPAAATIAKHGLSIGEMQKLQMEKIEELTLYIIQLKGEIELLKKR
ncbi:MAG: hypothetical protein V4722_13485 [Bacteroidota bacterium]